MPKQQFRLYFDADPDSLPPHSTRPATPEERRFLRRYNLIRLLRIFFFWLGASLVLGMVAAVHALCVLPLMDGNWVLLAILAALLLFLDWTFLRQWGKPLLQALATRPLLRIPRDLQIAQFSAPFGAQLHPTNHETNIFMAGPMVVELPGHWENNIARRMNESQDMLQPRIALARLPDAHNRIVRLPMRPNRYSSRRGDILLRDIGNIVIGWDDLSIDREMRARMPVIRANPDLMMPIILAGCVALLCYLISSSEADRVETKRDNIQSQLSRLTDEHLSGSAVDMDGLARRGFTGLTAPPAYDGRVVIADPFDYVPVGRGPGRNALYLRPEELAPIPGLANVLPHRIPGSVRPDASMIADYRAQLEKRSGTPAMLAALRAMPDGLVGAQLMARANGSRAAPAFVDALLPRPMIEAEDPPAYLIVAPIYPCTWIGTICAARAAPKTWQAPAFKTVDGRIRLFHASELDRIPSLKADLDRIKGDTSAAIWWRAMTVAACLGIALLLIGLAAARRLRRFYRPD